MYPLVNICPNCKNQTKYYPNPYYIHICSLCKHQCTMYQLITAVDVKTIQKEITKLEEKTTTLKKEHGIQDFEFKEKSNKLKHLQSLLIRFPHMENGELIEKN